MSANFFDNPALFRTALEELPLGVCIVDRDKRIRFWNRGAEHIIGHLSHEVVGRVSTEHIAEACDQHGETLCGDNCPVGATLRDGKPRQITAFYLHKQGHRVAVTIRSQAIVRTVTPSRARSFCLKKRRSLTKSQPGPRGTAAWTQ